jgi:hypothetical protein
VNAETLLDLTQGMAVAKRSKETVWRNFSASAPEIVAVVAVVL